jgi:hypothetical protein
MINYVRLTKEITSARARFTSASGACPLFLSGVVQDSKGRRLTLKGEPDGCPVVQIERRPFIASATGIGLGLSSR